MPIAPEPLVYTGMNNQAVCTDWCQVTLNEGFQLFDTSFVGYVTQPYKITLNFTPHIQGDFIPNQMRFKLQLYRGDVADYGNVQPYYLTSNSPHTYSWIVVMDYMGPERLKDKLNISLSLTTFSDVTGYMDVYPLTIEPVMDMTNAIFIGG